MKLIHLFNSQHLKTSLGRVKGPKKIIHKGRRAEVVGRGGGDIRTDRNSAQVPILKEVGPFGCMVEVPTKTPGLLTKERFHRSTRKINRENPLLLRH